VRILHVVQDPGIQPGRKKGANVHVEAMRKAFARLGHDVAALDEPDPARCVARFEELHARAPFDCVYERHALGRAGLALRAAELGVPHVHEVNAPLAEEEALYRAGARRADDEHERRAFAVAAGVLCVSSDCARYARERGASAAATWVEPNGVDEELFAPIPRDDPARTALVPPGRYAIGFHGRLRPWHNFPMLVEAFEQLVARGVPAHLVLLGEGDFESHLAGRVEAGRATRLSWVEHEQVGRIVAACDVLPLTYAGDAPCWFSPLKLLEAMSAGVVPVVPAMGDLESAVRHGHDGLVYAPGDLAALVDGLELLWRDEPLRARLAREARRAAAGRTWTSIARRVVERVARLREGREAV
jgi:glycosyltransferase involved in cell wall biosynthesis